MTNLNEITYVDWQLKLNTIGGVAEGAYDINHCIAIILLTRKDTHKANFTKIIYLSVHINLAQKVQQQVVINFGICFTEQFHFKHSSQHI